MPLEVICVFLVHVFSESLLVGLFLLQSCKLILPGFFELMVVFDLLLFLPFSFLYLFLEGLFVLLLKDALFICLFTLYFCLFLLKFLNLAIQLLNFSIFDLAHLEGLLLIEFFSLFDDVVDEVLLPFLSDILDYF